ncbi:MAG TPA: radical SAM protein [Acidisoma sp.]|uniref:radical SAM/SPASM domain-containing protein n=1 Tax=Acidisoma sp. TaxID=1872115 RepID=UPI002C4DC2F8|nr:radical SAM protein [Acidisoma sp.]HTI03457.1 radical SAM protein [Acidisoma sp.]
MSSFKASYYNRVVDHRDAALLFNGASGALVQLEAPTAALLAPFLGPERPKTAGEGLADWHPTPFAESDLPVEIRPLLRDFLEGGFFVSAGLDEQQALRQRLRGGSHGTSLYARITTTMSCNYACYYCFEDKSATHLTRPGCDAIFDWMRDQLDGHGYHAIFTDWFGGEPMLNQTAINYLSERLIAEAEARSLHYESAITCNGSLWPEDARGFVHRNRIAKVQLTLDGPPEHHRKRRRDRRDGAEDSFDAILRVVDEIHTDTKVVLRINVDPGMGDEVLDLIPFFQERGWLSGRSRVSPYLALIGPMTTHCGNLDNGRFRDFRIRFGALNQEFRHRLARPARASVTPRLPPFPQPLSTPCSAVTGSSVIFGPDGRMYRCVLDVGHAAMAHDALLPVAEGAQAGCCGTRARRPQDKETEAKPHPYLDYDPVGNARCGQCQYLPVCLGGCPKDQFEKNSFYIEERGAYWESNLDELLRMHADRTGEPALVGA